jgi:hypothetical protein
MEPENVGYDLDNEEVDEAALDILVAATQPANVEYSDAELSSYTQQVGLFTERPSQLTNNSFQRQQCQSQYEDGCISSIELMRTTMFMN